MVLIPEENSRDNVIEIPRNIKFRNLNEFPGHVVNRLEYFILISFKCHFHNNGTLQSLIFCFTGHRTPEPAYLSCTQWNVPLNIQYM